MANGHNFFGNSAGGQNFLSVSPLAIPELMQLFQRIQAGVPSTTDLGPVFQQILQSIPGQTRSFEDIVAQGAGSPLFQQILQPALEALAPSEDLAREALTDRFRAAGALRSGAFGVAAPRLEQDILGKRGSLISQVLSQMLQPLISGSLQAQQNAFLPARALTDLLAQRVTAERNRFLPTSSLIDLFGAARPQVDFRDSFGNGGGGFRSSSNRIADEFSQFSPASQAVRRFNANNPFDPFGPSFSDLAGPSAGRAVASAPTPLDQFINPDLFGVSNFGGTTTGSLRDIFQDPFTGGFSNFPSDIENLPFFNPIDGGFEF